MVDGYTAGVSGDRVTSLSAESGGVRRLAPPPRALPLATAAAVVVAVVSAGFWIFGLRAAAALDTTDAWDRRTTVGVAALATIVTLLSLPALRSVALALRSRSICAGGD